MSKVLTSLPVGRARRHRLLRRPRHLRRRRLDARQGRGPVHLHRRHRPVRRARHRRRTRPRAGSTAPSSPAPSTAAPSWSRRAWPRWPAAPSTSAPAAGPTSTPRRSAAPSPAPCWCARCTRTASTSGATARRSRATTSSGSTATACWPTPSCASTSRGWTPTSSHELGGRAEMSQWLTEHDLPYRDSQEKAYSTDANIWGATHEAKTLEHLDVSLEIGRADHGREVLGPRRRDRDRGRHDPLRAGPSGGDQRHDVRRPGRAGPRGQRDRWPARARHVRPDREPDHRGQVARHLRGARAWRCSGSPTSGCVNAIHNEDTHRELPRARPPARPAAVRGPLARPAGADAARVDPALDRLGGHRRGHPPAAPRRGLHDPAHRRARRSPTTPTSCRWSAPRTPPSAPPTGSAS